MQTFTLQIPDELLPVLLEAVVNIHGLTSEEQTPDERAKELVIQFLGDIVNQDIIRKAQAQIKPIDLSAIE